MFNPINLIVTIVKAVFISYNNRKVIQVQANNLYTTGYNINNVLMTTPYGMFALPNDNTNAMLLSVNDSSKAMQCIGFLQSLPDSSPININTGEFCYASDNWSITWKNNGLIANKLDDPAYINAWLINGSWVNYYLLNRITEIENIITEVNNNYTALVNEFNAHLHSVGTYTGINDPATNIVTITGNSGTSTTSLTQTALPIPSTLNEDTTSINNQEDLFNDNAMPSP